MCLPKKGVLQLNYAKKQRLKRLFVFQERYALVITIPLSFESRKKVQVTKAQIFLMVDVQPQYVHALCPIMSRILTIRGDKPLTVSDNQ